MRQRSILTDPIYLIRSIKSRRMMLCIVAVLVLAAGLRLYGIDWDRGYGFHPDERSIYMQADCMYKVLTHGPGYQECPNLSEYPDMESGIPSVGVFFDSGRSALNPHWFPLGSIMIYLMVLIRSVVEPFGDFNGLDMRFAGRTLSALADVGSVFLIFLIGRRLFGSKVGLLAAFLLSITVIHVQTSHYYRPETFLGVLTLASFWFMLNILHSGRQRDWMFLGLFVGLTFAVKVSVVPLLLLLVLVFGFRVFGWPDGTTGTSFRRQLFMTLRHATVGSVIAIFVFLVINPYAIIDFSEFISDTTWEAGIARVAGKMPYTVQYVGSLPIIYELRQSTIWALGIPLGIVSWVGLIYAGYSVIAKKPTWKPELLLVAWVLSNFLLIGLFFEVKFLRYIFPIIPLLVLFGARGLVSLVDSAHRIQKSLVDRQLGFPVWRVTAHYSPHIAVGLIIVVVLSTAMYTAGFMGIYSRPHPAVEASIWINDNVRPGTTVITDNHWDEGIPELYRYNVVQIPIYEGDSDFKMRSMSHDLSRAEYLVFYSNRTYGSISRVPELYPQSANYYQKLFSGELGYKLDRIFTSYPEFLGVTWKNDTFGRARLPEPELMSASSAGIVTLNLGYADENVVNYDHPAVLLFRNDSKLPQHKIYKSLTPTRSESKTQNSLLAADVDRIQRSGGTWSSVVQEDSWTNKMPVLAWILIVELIYLVTLPLAFFIFRPLPDRGIIFAKILGILSVSYIVWLLASLHWLSFSRYSMLIAILVMASLSTAVLVAKYREMIRFLRNHWRLMVASEVLFLVAFLVFVVVRMANPDLWHPFRGGEKPMDFAYLNAILRSTYMPPFDPWFSGGYINYYYWGIFIVANLTKSLGMLPAVAYNLAVPLFFALTVTGVYSLAFNVAEGLRTTGRVGDVLQSSKGGLNIVMNWVKTPAFAGLIAVFFVCIIANLDGAVQLIQSGWSNVIHGEPFRHFDFWRSSRMIPGLADYNPSLFVFWLDDRIALAAGSFCAHGLRLDSTCPDISPHITEFPFFTFLFADLHAHLIVIPFGLLVLGFCLSFLVGLKSATKTWVIVVVPFFGLSLGALWVINAWDYPSYVLLMLAAMSVGAHLMVGRAKHDERVWTFIGVALAVVLFSVISFIPFHGHYEVAGSFVNLSKWRTPFPNFLGIHGIFLVIVLAYLIQINNRALKFGSSYVVSSIFGWLRPAFSKHTQKRRSFSWEMAAAIFVVAVVMYLAVTGYWVALLMMLFIGLVFLVIREEFGSLNASSGFFLFPVVIIGFSCLIIIGVDFIRVGDDIGRMNTVFKFYLEAWVLIALGAAVGLWYLIRIGYFNLGLFTRNSLALLISVTSLVILLIVGLMFWSAVQFEEQRSLGQSSWFDALRAYSVPAIILHASILAGIVIFYGRNMGSRFNPQGLPKALLIVLLVILVGSSSVYVGLGSRARLSDRFNTTEVTLNGEKFLSSAIHIEGGQEIELKWDYEAIRWLRSNAVGSPVVLEAHLDQYHWGGRFSIYTGLPTVIGWPWHQIQQRGSASPEVGKRAEDVRRAYTSHDIQGTLDILYNYNVSYVIVGDLERSHYPQSGLTKFVGMVGRGHLEYVYDNGHTAIYRVLPQS